MDTGDKKNEAETESTKRWLDWCRKHNLVKCTEQDVPDGILPKGYRGTLIDVKVHGRKWGPDDRIYSANEDLRRKVARGNCVLELHQIGKGVITSTKYLFLVFALKKFSGGMGDEDDVNDMCQNSWQKYFIKPITSATKVVCTVKANGEAAHISCRRIEDSVIFCIGSKNVHLLARNLDDVLKYKDGRYLVAREVAKAFFTHMDSITETQKSDMIFYLIHNKYTIVAELLQPKYQHVEDFSWLTSSSLRFICWTLPPDDKEDDVCDTLCAIPPNRAIDKARSFGLQTVDYMTIPAIDAEDYMSKVRQEKNYEGRVMYFLDENEKCLGVLKKKTTWYIILRAIREKACSACNPKSSYNPDDKKVAKRINEIQTWIGFSDNYKRVWTKLGTAFVEWAVRVSKRSPENQVGLRSQFPVLWNKFLNSNEECKLCYENLNYS